MITSQYLTCSTDSDSSSKTPLYVNTNIFVCLDGPPGIGKTLISDIVTDYTCYLDEMLAREDIRTMNECLMFVDYTTMLCNLNKRTNIPTTIINSASDNDHSHIIINRSIFSSFIYSMFLKYRGHKLKPEIFKNIINENIFNSPLIMRMHQQWVHILNSHTAYLSNYQYRILWILPQNMNLVYDNLKTTKFYCVNRNRIVLKYYCENLIYLFEKFAKTTNIGDILNVGSRVIRIDIENFYKNTTENYEYLSNQ